MLGLATFPARGTMTNALRSFFLEDAVTWPQGLKLYVWLYPANHQVIVRGLGILRVLGSTYGPIVGDILKFFPVAFWITDGVASGVPYRLTEIPLSTARVAGNA